MSTSRIRRPIVFALVMGLFILPVCLQLASPAHAQGGPTIDQQIKLLEMKTKAAELELKVIDAWAKANASEIKTMLKKMKKDVAKIKSKIEALL